ncbi:hypothetical protein MKW98_029734 [Papaver atlanticum]|uniref:Retinoblastoma-associated protein A-box domain-containing protein n=1 Tax=Papaver atlanticum TaxID=357466 RepID=A0AAD4T692_9MAGN|nr:hypothetical protein MKW98_029734 [Papaver atlanticum]
MYHGEPAWCNTDGQHIGRTATIEGLKLYYRVLETICRAESQRLHVAMLFPAVLERTGITAFYLSKVIESFIRHEESLPRELRRHQNSLEEPLEESWYGKKAPHCTTL